MKKSDFSLMLLLAFIGAYAFGGGWYGAKISQALNPEPEQIVRERVVALQPIVLERNIDKSCSCPVQVTLGGCAQSNLSDESDPSDGSDQSDEVDEEQSEAAAAAEPATEQPAVPPPPPVDAYRPAAVFGLPTGLTRPAAPISEPSSLWELRKVLGAGVRGGVELGKDNPEYSGTLYGFWEFLRVRDTYLTSYVEANNNRTAKIQLDLQWRKP